MEQNRFFFYRTIQLIETGFILLSSYFNVKQERSESMRIITETLLQSAADELKTDEKFLHESRAFTGTVTFEDEEGAAYMTFFRGTLMEIGDGYSLFGSEYYISASTENWMKAFTEADPRFGIYELDGDLISFKGNQYTFAANAKAFYSIWLAVRDAYISNPAEGGAV